MSEIIALQQRFARQTARLILAADVREVPVRFGHAWRDPRVYRIVRWAFANGYSDGLPEPKCHPRSLHFERLAVDLIAENPTHHITLHDLWDTMDDNASPRIRDDMNHYSFQLGGMT